MRAFGSRTSYKMTPLALQNILLGEPGTDKNSAVLRTGDLLLRSGYVDPEYIGCILQREQNENTYIGKGIAIPHGTDGSEQHIRRAGFCILQFPEGLSYGYGYTVHLLIGLAIPPTENSGLFGRLADLFGDDATRRRLFTTDDPNLLLNVFSVPQ